MNRKSPRGSAALTGLKVVASLLFLSSTLLAADPVVSNVQGQQRPGTKLVDITYDVTADTPTVAVTLRISSDGGATFDVPATTLSGAVGPNVPVGTDKVITWNAGTDWLGSYSTAMRFEIKVDDGVVPAPEGFVYVAAGALPADSWAGAQAVDGFFMAKTEVTWAEFQTVRTWAAANGYDIGSVGAGTGPNRPVTNLSWYQSLKWCNARSEKDGLRPVYKVGTAVYRSGNSVPTIDPTANGYRLPGEKEWEFAARGGVKTNGYEYGGSNDVNAVAWYSGNSSNSTQDVATKLANELGLSDMSGNVWEWCFDASGSYRVFRGGSWNFYAYYCRVADRNYDFPTKTNSYFGFRVARSSVAATHTSQSGDAVVDTRYWSLILSATENGTFTGGGIFNLGASATLTATPNPGYRFTGWTGDASGTVNPLTITMNADKTVGATFAKDLSDADSDGLTAYDELVVYGTNPSLADSDGDGLSDGAELNTHGSNPKLADTDGDGLSDSAEVVTHGTNPAAKDSDADGFDDLFEINTGFNPTQAGSTPDAQSGIQTAVKFWFNAAQGVSYRIEASADLETWETIEAVVVGEGGRVTRFYDIEGKPKRYFRVKRN